MPRRPTLRRLAAGPPLLPVLLAAALALSACASTGGRLADEHRTPLSEPMDVLWAELPDVYRDLGLPVAELPTREPVIRTGDVALNDGRLPRVSDRRLVSCPADAGEPVPRAEGLAFLRVRTRLEGAGSAADVVTEVEAWRTTDRGRRRACRSTGVLERRIADELRRRV